MCIHTHVYEKSEPCIYDQNLDLTRENCIDMYHIVDYLSVESVLEEVQNFVKENLTFENTIDLMTLMGDKLENEIVEFYENNKLTDIEKFIAKLNKASQDVFLSVIHLIFEYIDCHLICKMIKSWFEHNSQSRIEDVIPEISYIFDSEDNERAADFSHKEKFKFYNFCLQRIDPESKYLGKIFNDIFIDGEYEEEKLDNDLSETTIFELLEEPTKIFKKLCTDDNPEHDKRNAKMIKMLSNDDEVKKTIEHGTDSKINKLELVEACKNGQMEIVKMLLECNANINARENFGYVSKCGTKYGYRTIPSKRTYQRDEITRHYKYKYFSPLTISCYSKQTEIVKLLLSKQCNIDVIYMTTNFRADERRKYDALHAACRRQNNEEIIDLLMEKKKDWNFEHITEEYDCDATMVAYVNSKRNIEEE